MREEQQELKKPFGLLGNWFLVLLALLLCGGSYLMMYQEVRLGGVAAQEGSFLLRFGALSILYGFALLVIFWVTADKRLAGLAGFAGFALLIASYLAFVPGLTYPKETHIWINAGGLGIPAQELAILGYILVAAFLVERLSVKGSRAVLLWATGIFAMGALWFGKGSMMVVFLSILAFTGVWADKRRFSLILLLLLGAAALATLLYALRMYDTFVMQGRDLKYFNAELLRIAGWILPSAKSKTPYGVVTASLWAGAGLHGRGMEQLRDLLPEIRFTDADFSLMYVTSYRGKVALAVVLVVYCLLLWQIYIRADKALMEGDRLRGTLAFGVFIRFALGALFHIGYCFQVLPSFHSFMPFVTYVGQYQLLSLLELGLVLRVNTKPSRAYMLAEQQAEQQAEQLAELQ